jgi:Mrp family chromosome partitioning ATPase
MDGTILVLRAKDNSRGVAQRATTLLQHMNAHLLGAVLNAAQARRGGYFREQLRTFYDYQSEDERNRPALPGDNGRGHRKAGKEEDADA